MRGFGEELLTKCGVQAIEVAWCTKARNNARVIPDGVITGVSFLKTGTLLFTFYFHVRVSGGLTYYGKTSTFKSMATGISHS